MKQSSLTVMAIALWLAPRPAGAVELTTLNNSPGVSEVLSVNRQGTILGRREIADAGALSMELYLREGNVDRAVPIPEGFTHVEAQVITDRSQVVGFATRPLGTPGGLQRGLVWTIAQDRPELLPIPDGFGGSCAFDAAQDGRSVCGYVLGSGPPRMIPCVWQRPEDGSEWSCQLLSVLDTYNPLLVSAHVMISDDGQLVVAPLVTAVLPSGQRTYGLFVWQRQPAGDWQRRQVADRAVYLGDINDAGLVAGRVSEAGKRRAVIVDPTHGLTILPLPAGRDTAYATDVNRWGQVVGVSEDRPGPEGTMSAFVWHGGQLAALPFPIAVEASTANTITDDGRVGGLLVRETSADEPSPVESFVLRIDTPAEF
jgi:hypothetical protein